MQTLKNYCIFFEKELKLERKVYMQAKTSHSSSQNLANDERGSGELFSFGSPLKVCKSCSGPEVSSHQAEQL